MLFCNFFLEVQERFGKIDIGVWFCSDIKLHSVVFSKWRFQTGSYFKHVLFLPATWGNFFQCYKTYSDGLNPSTMVLCGYERVIF